MIDLLTLCLMVRFLTNNQFIMSVNPFPAYNTSSVDEFENIETKVWKSFVNKSITKLEHLTAKG